jgi:hypothetical protein
MEKYTFSTKGAGLRVTFTYTDCPGDSSSDPRMNRLSVKYTNVRTGDENGSLLAKGTVASNVQMIDISPNPDDDIFEVSVSVDTGTSLQFGCSPQPYALVASCKGKLTYLPAYTTDNYQISKEDAYDLTKAQLLFVICLTTILLLLIAILLHFRRVINRKDQAQKQSRQIARYK